MQARRMDARQRLTNAQRALDETIDAERAALAEQWPGEGMADYTRVTLAHNRAAPRNR